MADQIKKLSAGHSIEVLDAIMTEVEEARGEYESLDARLDEISGEGYSKAEVDALLALKQNALTTSQLAAVNSGIDSAKVEQIEINKNNISLLDEEINRTPKVVYTNNLLLNTSTTMAATGLEYTITGVVTGATYRITAVAAYNASQPDEIRLVNKANGALYGVAVRNTIATNASVTVTGCVTVGVNITIEVQAKYVAAGNNYIYLIVEKIQM